MATKTKQQLVERALQILNVLGAGQSPSAEDAQTVGDMVSPMFDFLNASGLIAVAHEDLIEASVFEPLARLLSAEAAPTFGGQKDPGDMEDARMQIRLVVNGRPTYQVARTDYF